MAKKNVYSYDYKKKEVQTKADLLLWTIISEISSSSPDRYWRLRSQNDQQDKGVDFEIELENKLNSDTLDLFKIQNKGIGEALHPITTSKNAGLIPFQLSVRHANYYRYQIPLGLIFTLCDTINGIIYWHPIQLDDELDVRVKSAVAKGQRSVQIYLDPTRTFDSLHIEEFVHAIDQSYKIQHKRFRQFQRDKKKVDGTAFKNAVFKIDVDKSMHILDQLHDFATKAFNELVYLPKSLLLPQYPFKVSSSYYPYHSEFGLSVDNDKIIELLTAIAVTDGQVAIIQPDYFKRVQDPLEKLEFVLKRLNHNLIETIENGRGTSVHNIKLYSSRKCYCSHCRLLSIDFPNALLQIETPTTDLKEQLRNAYVCHQMGLHLRAYEILKNVVAKSCDDQLNTIYLIANYNLRKLRVFISSRYYGKNERPEVIANIERIDLDEINQLYSTINTEPLFDYIVNQSYYSEASEKINEIVGKIRDHHHIYITGGSSNNSNVQLLLAAYAEIDQFLKRNYVIFDRFDEFKRLTDNFIEGIIAAHAIKDEHNSRLIHVPDWIIVRMINRGNPDSIIKHANRYKLNSLKLIETSASKSALVLLSQNFFEYAEETEVLSYALDEVEQKAIGERYANIFKNLLVLLGLAELPSMTVDSIAERIIGYIRANYFNNYGYVKYLKYFINKQRDCLSMEVIRKFIDLGISTALLHDEYYFQSICDLLKRRKLKIELDLETFNALANLAFEKCTVCGHEHSPNLILYFHGILKSNDQITCIERGVQKKLENKFDSNIYYLATILGVVSYAQYFDEFIAKVQPSDQTTSFRSSFSGVPETRFNGLNMIINIAYKYQLDLDDGMFDHLRKINSYYEWLFNLGEFDYANFQPKWITEYPTKFYFMEFEKVKKIRKLVVEYLRENENYAIERDLLNILFYSQEQEPG